MGSSVQTLDQLTSPPVTMINRVRLKLWNHWFWITIVMANLICHGSSESLLVEPQPDNISILSYPILQSVNVNEGRSDPNVVVSSTVSVSKVSVKKDVSVGSERSLHGFEHNLNNNYLGDVVSLPIVNPRVAQPPDNFLQQLLDQLQQVASVSVAVDNLDHAEAVTNNIDDADDVHYQLVYKDDEDYYSDYDQYDLDHLSDEYLDYLYQIYDEMNNDITYFDDDTENVVNPEAEAVVILHEDYLDEDSTISRSEQAKGRALDVEEDITEQLFENVVAPASEEVVVVAAAGGDIVTNKMEYVDKFLNISKEEVKEETTETIEDFVVEELKHSNNSDVYIKIGIFITVSLAVLIMTGGLIFVMMRRKIKTVAEASLVTNEDEANCVNNQVVFQKGLKTSTTSSLQEHFNNHFGKSAGSAAYLYDDLHSLDNDSFLTSLETISEKDKFNWE